MALTSSAHESFVNPVYVQGIQNDSDQEITWLFENIVGKVQEQPRLHVDTMIIAPHTKSLGIDEFYFFSLPGNNDSNYIKNSISIYDTNDFEECKFQMYLGEELINEWSPPTGSFGDSINSPFNYDSWEASAYDEVVETSGWEFIHGELIFTITNEDLE